MVPAYGIDDWWYGSLGYHSASCQLTQPPVPRTHKAVIIPVQVGSGTDPTEGAALAAALLDALADRALLTLATTHHASLKDMAVSTTALSMCQCGSSCCASRLVPARRQMLPGKILYGASCADLQRTLSALWPDLAIPFSRPRTGASAMLAWSLTSRPSSPPTG